MEIREMGEIMDLSEGEKLAGYKKKSFSLPYNGGEIWCEHLDGIYKYEELVLRKLAADTIMFTRPSCTSYVCFVFDETNVTDNIRFALRKSVLESGKRFMRIAFVGLDRYSVRKIRKDLCGNGFAVNFLDGLEDAKEWLLN